MINPFLVPREVDRLRDRTRHLSDRFLDPIVDAGRGDLVLDFASPVPAIITLELMGLSSGNWKHFADFFHATTSYLPGSDEFNEAVAHGGDMMAELLDHAVRPEPLLGPLAHARSRST